MKGVERGLLIAGLSLGGWAALASMERRYIAAAPIPVVATTAPGAAPTPRGAWVARLEAPSVGLSATVLEGSDDQTLDRAAGHIEYTAFPGKTGNVGIAGHRDTTFRRVRHLEIGDRLMLQTSDATYEYRIVQTQIVKPDAVEVLSPTPTPTLTLVTCYPFTFIGNAPKRYVVSAELTSVIGNSESGIRNSK
jgi:LPXTG-site transpeptidase (sortase) family protein